MTGTTSDAVAPGGGGVLMADAALALPLLDIGGWITVVGLIVVAMARGWLVPASQQDKMIAAYDKLIADKDRQIDMWRKAAELSDRRGDLLAENQRELLEVGRTNNELIRAIGGGDRA